MLHQRIENITFGDDLRRKRIVEMYRGSLALDQIRAVLDISNQKLAELILEISIEKGKNTPVNH